MSTFVLELRQAAHALRRAPAFTLAAALTLSLGIGLNSTMLAVFDRLLLRPLPFRDADHLVAIYDANTRLGWTQNRLSEANLLDYQRRATRFEAIAGHASGSVDLAGEGEPTRVDVTAVSSTFFPLLGVQPLLGRNFTAEEDRPDGPGAVILGHGFWTSRLGGDPSIVGRTLRVNGVPSEVVGVLPPGFHLGELLTGQVFLPLAPGEPQGPGRGNHVLSAVGRLRPGSSVAAADRDLKRVARQLAAEYPDTNADGSATVLPLVEAVTDRRAATAWLFLGLSAFLLLIACANVSNLVLARGVERQHELAIRAALGAGRAALMRGVLAECTVLGLIGAAGSVLVEWGLLTLMERWFPTVPQLREIGLDAETLACGLFATFLATAFSSLVPLWRLSRVELGEATREGRRSSPGLRERRFQAALLAAQVGLSMVLLTGAGLMVRSLWRLQQVELGFDPDGVLTAAISLQSPKYERDEDRLEFVRRLQERLDTLPGARSASVANSIPIVRRAGNREVGVVGEPPLPSSQGITTVHNVTPSHFATLGIPLRQGDVPRSPAPDACLVNEVFLRRHGLGRDAVGRQLRADSLGNGPELSLTITGVVGDVRHLGLHREPEPQLYTFLVPGSRLSPRMAFVHVRSAVSPWSLSGPLKATLRELDPDLALADVRTLDQAIDGSLETRRTTTALFLAFGVLGLVLAAVGLYGLMAYVVARRRCEMGIRTALGADASRLVAMVLGQSLRLTMAGLAVGLLACLALGRAVASLLYGVQPTDAPTYLAVATLLLVVSVVAALVPALRAASVDPAVVLREP